jgi:hypothetical protein
VQRYLQTLEEQGEILREQVDGRGGRLVIVLQSGFHQGKVFKQTADLAAATPGGPGKPQNKGRQ